MHENPFDVDYGSGETEYERYLRTSELLSLQKPAPRRSHPDELLFQVIHQVEELWMKAAIHELGETARALPESEHEQARAALCRAGRLFALCANQLLLFDTMLPSAYLVIRRGLGRGSGMDSPGYCRVGEVVPAVWGAFEGALGQEHLDLVALYQEPSPHPRLLAVAEAMVSFDAEVQRFKREHIMTVRRIIGTGTASLRGNPMDMLERSAKLTHFPMLWAVRDRMFLDFRTGPLSP